MKTKPKLRKGWSWPVKSSEVSTWFGEVEYVRWIDPSWSHKWSSLGNEIIRVELSPRGRKPRLRLDFLAVESDLRAPIHEWMTELVVPAAREWISTLPDRPDTWQDKRRQISWKWNGDPTSIEVSETESAY